jgi:TatD DNase family protein
MTNLFFQDDPLFDSHCHLNEANFDADRDTVVQRAVENGIEKIIDIAVDVAAARRAVANAKQYKGVVFAAVGLDPDIVTPGSDIYKPDLDIEVEMTEVRELAIQNKDVIAAIGESGMDDHWVKLALTEGKITAEEYQKVRERQERFFLKHLELAAELDLPLTIHSRGIEKRCLEIVKEFPNVKGVFHSYTGDYETAKQILDASWGLGVNGIVTFKKATELREMYRKLLGQVPENWTVTDFYNKGIYFETDAPYLAPEGKRGERNEPAHVKSIFEQFIQLLK